VNRAKEELLDRSKAAGADFLQLRTADAPVGGLSEWLADRVRTAIADGRLPVDSRLPPSRVLAFELGVSRGVVTEAYQRLIDDGHVAGRGRAGSIVLAAPIPAPAARASGTSPTVLDVRVDPAAGVFAAPTDVALFDRMRAVPARFDLSPGVPDLAAFPRTAWLRAERSVLDTLAPADFGYGDPRGTPALRIAVAGWLARTRGIAIDPADVIIVAGVAQALALLAQILHADGTDTVAVEDPGSLGVRQHLQHWGLHTPPVAVDDHGLDVASLREAGHPAVMLTPAHQFPTGVVLDGARRRDLLHWAEGGGLILEDDYDAEYRYDRAPVPALRALAAEHVCYTGSISKLLAPALRIGWLLTPRRYRDAVIDAKRFADLGNAALPQLVLARLMTSGDLERQLRMLRRRHTTRRDAMITALRTRIPEAQIHGAAAGLHLLITFDAGLSDTALAAAALERGVKTQPLSWHTQQANRPGLVLGYAANTPTQIATAITKVADARRTQQKRRAR
jgi:GntR family transcriptional regulator/MocR family aminotransferase